MGMQRYMDGRDKLTRQKCPHAKRRHEPRLLSRFLVLEAQLQIERVGEDDGFFLCDSLLVVEGPHRLDEFKRVAAVLAHAGEDLGVGFACAVCCAVQPGVQGRGGSSEGLRGWGSGRRAGGLRGVGACSGGGEVRDLFPESLEEGRRPKSIC